MLKNIDIEVVNEWDIKTYIFMHMWDTIKILKEATDL